MSKVDLSALKKDPRKAKIAVPSIPDAPIASKKKVERPKTKTEPEKTINVSIPVSVLEKMGVAKIKYNNNLTQYVNAVIKADLDVNYSKYLEIKDILNS